MPAEQAPNPIPNPALHAPPPSALDSARPLHEPVSGAGAAALDARAVAAAVPTTVAVPEEAARAAHKGSGAHDGVTKKASAGRNGAHGGAGGARAHDALLPHLSASSALGRRVREALAKDG